MRLVDRDSAPIDLHRLASEKIAELAVTIMERVCVQRESYRRFKGKRMQHDRSLISIPLGYRHRLLIRETADGGKIPLCALTHEQYNKEKIP